MSKILPASQIITSLLLGTASAAIGFYLGRRQSTQLQDQYSSATEVSTEVEETRDDEDDDEEDDEGIADGDLAAITPGLAEACKMVLVVRTDLKMTAGKISAQCGHATLACYKVLVKENPKLVRHWERTGQAKIALKGTSEEQLLELEAIAKSLNLCARSIVDAGRTQIEPGTMTVLAIGPAPVRLINEVTGSLRLL
ncbi:peptidyl-tRNA hydrolase PTH2-domain-containing protein [Lentinula boryana]|uniref:peptidyl-tRNA hydrolase n=1 Tax=Lentinula boryana TaxID=40481 RepID=A0ABQ8QJA1_9AGAR|nr:peptidyl-tRNA hydrolase PTH2-domain-containing protein [Lentinula boryana]